MKRAGLATFALLIAVSAFAGETQRYIVGTQRTARVGSLSKELSDPAGRRVRTFRLIDGFAADLTPEEASALRRDAGVRYVERVVERHLHASVSKPGEQMIPSGVAQVHAPQAWAGWRGGGVNVAVIDSGIDWTHPDVAYAYAGGYNVIEDTDQPLDDLGHGTHVAGIIGATNNVFGVVGVAPGVRLWALKVVDENGQGVMDDVIAALEWVADKKKEAGGRWVVNMSLGGTTTSIAEHEAFTKAASEGLILVASSGNTSTASTTAAVEYPAAYPEVIAVGATGETNVHANFSNGGPELDFVAPGVRIVSTVLTGGAWVSYARTDDRIITTKPLTGAQIGKLSGEWVYCGLGGVNDFPASVNGKIALIKRGGDTFADKTRHALAAGAIGVAFFNHDESNFSFTLKPADDPDAQTYPWPIAVAMSKADGDALAARGSGKMTIAYDPDDYDVKSGTSMSAPHVTGAIALLWAMAPDATAAQITNALITTATDLGDPGRDVLYGNGQIDVFAASKMLAPNAYTGITTGRRILTRRRN
ncbi:MAG TPA: S8 family serine peptidase [Thermoanaerobaculia bacterium]|nr:S8 family serine peptidase [Thermoanaerobaculia bacterium]